MDARTRELTRNTIRADAEASYAAEDGTMFFSLDALTPEAREILRQRSDDPEDRARLARIRRIEAEAPVQYGLAEALPHGAVAMIVRDPRPQRLLVFAESTVSDRVLSLARVLLRVDEVEHPDIGSRRVIVLRADGTTEAQGKARHVAVHVPDVDRGDARELVGRARRIASTPVDGVGPVRILESR